MQDKIYSLLRDNVGTEFVRGDGIYNIFPKHIPDGAMDNNFSRALIYNIIQGQVNLTATLYTVQLSVFHSDYSECRRLAVLIKELFNKKDFTGEAEGLLSTDTIEMIELEFDTDTQLYGIAVNTLFKTSASW